jgi:hypothetical protein
MLRGLLVAAFLTLAVPAGAQSEDAASPPADDIVPEHATNRRENTDPKRSTRGYYSSRGGVSPANPGGNAFGREGSAYPSDGGRAYPTVPNNR